MMVLNMLPTTFLHQVWGRLGMGSGNFIRMEAELVANAISRRRMFGILTIGIISVDIVVRRWIRQGERNEK